MSKTLAEKRVDPDPNVRWQAAKADRLAGDRDMSWVRNDPNSDVRWEAAKADCEAGRDITWVRNDLDPSIRILAGPAEMKSPEKHECPVCAEMLKELERVKEYLKSSSDVKFDHDNVESFVCVLLKILGKAKGIDNDYIFTGY